MPFVVEDMEISHIYRVIPLDFQVMIGRVVVARYVLVIE